MLPDIWRMAERRMRATAPREVDGDGPDAQLLRGINHHLEADAWYHRTLVHAQGEQTAHKLLVDSASHAKKLGLFAHVLWEMALDGALLEREGIDATLAQLRGSLQRCRGVLSAVAIQHGARERLSAVEQIRFDRRVDHILQELARGPWIAGYTHGIGLVDRLSGVRSRFGFAPFAGAERDSLAEQLRPLIVHAKGALEELESARLQAIREQ